ncbi:MAG: prepilin-type N-terminal cleavage/methylation domain-containing protein [bacterium]|nr:prepilin-type N-terminal cleavage/methylation domain-containing protein [bacterium]
MNFKRKTKTGFTLIELLIVVAIIFIVFALSVVSFRFYEKKSTLNNTVKEIVAVLKSAQNKTLASEGNSKWGVYFDSGQNRFILFKGSEYNPEGAENEINEISERIEISALDLAGGENKIVFKRLTGETDQFGSVSLRLKENPAEIKTIYIENSGQIFSSLPVNPDDESRVRDSRHFHFDLGWSIQNATTLKFNFIDSGQIKTQDMVAFFNGDKTEFNWNNEEEPFVIDEANQIFKIHTHYLDGANTVLCIHRERGENQNNQEVFIYIVDGGVDKEIAHYFADSGDSIAKGFYVSSFEPQ